jgi:hypothetical protein
VPQLLLWRAALLLQSRALQASEQAELAKLQLLSAQEDAEDVGRALESARMEGSASARSGSGPASDASSPARAAALHKLQRQHSLLSWQLQAVQLLWPLLSCAAGLAAAACIVSSFTPRALPGEARDLFLAEARRAAGWLGSALFADWCPAAE